MKTTVKLATMLLSGAFEFCPCQGHKVANLMDGHEGEMIVRTPHLSRNPFDVGIRV